jgi:hypothetical protein
MNTGNSKKFILEKIESARKLPVSLSFKPGGPAIARVKSSFGLAWGNPLVL